MLSDVLIYIHIYIYNYITIYLFIIVFLVHANVQTYIHKFNTINIVISIL